MNKIINNHWNIYGLFISLSNSIIGKDFLKIYSTITDICFSYF